MPQIARLLSCIMVMGLVSFATACTGTVRTITPVAVKSGLSALNEEESRALIKRIVETPEVSEVILLLGHGLGMGVMDGITYEARRADVEDLTETVARAIRKAALNHQEELEAALRKLGSLPVEGALSGALSEKNHEAISRLLSRVVGDATRAAMASAAEGLRTDLGPELRAAIERDLGPALAAVVRNDVAPALSDALSSDLRTTLLEMTRELSRQATLGAQDALVQTNTPHQATTFLGRLQQLLAQGAHIGHVLIVMLLIGVIGLIVLLRKASIDRDKREAEGRKREATLMMMLEAMHRGEGDGRPIADELLTMFRNDLKAAPRRRGIRSRFIPERRGHPPAGR